MSGGILVSPSLYWSAATWYFNWVLTEVASEISEPNLQDKLTEIVDENLGWLRLDDLSDAEQDDFKSTANRVLLPKLEEASLTGINRQQAVDHLKSLLAMFGWQDVLCDAHNPELPER